MIVKKFLLFCLISLSVFSLNIEAFFYAFIILEDIKTRQKIVLFADFHDGYSNEARQQMMQIVDLGKELKNEGKSVNVIVEDMRSFQLKENYGENVNKLIKSKIDNDSDQSFLDELDTLYKETFKTDSHIGGITPLIWIEPLCKKHSLNCENIEFRDDGSLRNIEKQTKILNEIKKDTSLLFGQEFFPWWIQHVQTDERFAGVDMRMLNSIAGNQTDITFFCVGGVHTTKVAKFLLLSNQYKTISACGYKIPNNFPINDQEERLHHETKITNLQNEIFRFLNVKAKEPFTDLKEAVLQEIHALSSNLKTRD